MRNAYIILAGAVSLIAFSRAGLANSNRITGINVSNTIRQNGETQGANETLTFATTSLSPGSDTVIHVQNLDDLQRGFIAGNDDFSGVASQVTIPPVGYSRNLLILVRSYSNVTQGTCTLTATSSTRGSWNIATNLPFGGTKWWLGGGLQAGAHVTTVEQQGGATDTVVLTLSSTEHGVGFNDDSGVGLMSYVHNPEAAPAAYAVIANWNDTGTYPTTLVWDDWADSTDYDSDGLGAELETMIGTCPGPGACPSGYPANDSDYDGLKDGDELLGVETWPYPAVKLPAWGADPTTRDAFFEMDWHQCTAPGCGGNLDASRTSAAAVAEAKARFLAAGVRVHFDIGRVNTDPSTWYDWGAWGGASRQTQFPNPSPPAGQPPVDTCWGRSVERDYKFRHAYVWGGLGIVGYAPYRPGACFAASSLLSQEGKIIAHESGHNQGLHHGGRPNALAANYKAHYASIMNYTYEYNASSVFSGGALPTLNPTSLKETDALGTTAASADVLNAISAKLCPGGWCISGTNIDWNLDRIFEPSGTTVRANVVLGDFSQFARTEFSGVNLLQLNNASMAWTSIGGAIGDRLWVYSGQGGSPLQFAFAARSQINSACGNITALTDEWNTPCAVFTNATNWPGYVTTNVGPAAAEVNGQSMVISSRPSTSNIVSNILSVNGSNGQLTYGPDVALPSSSLASGDLAAISYGSGTVKVWAPLGAQLNEWTFSSGSWSGPVAQQWEDGTYINPSSGIGVTLGYDGGAIIQYTYAAIPSVGGVLEFARKDPSTGRWFRPPVSMWSGLGASVTAPIVRGRPGLAYKPRLAGGPVSDGRFYLAFNQNEAAGCAATFGPPTCNAKIVMTEGNLATTSPNRRLLWVGRAWDFGGTTALGAAYTNLTGGINLMFDLTRDTGLRAMWTTPPDAGGYRMAVFSPFADGIFNGSLQDLYDLNYVGNGLRAALCLEPNSSWPWGALPSWLP